jgi:predicted nucleic acid-binding protein
MLIYLDICCFNRPFDDQSDLLVRLQTEAKLYVQEMIRGGSLSLIWYSVMELENAVNPDMNRKLAVGEWKKIGFVDVPVSRRVEGIAGTLARIGVKPMDALHAACAMEAEAEYFLTTDKALLRKMAKYDHLRVVDPVDFIRVLKETQNED